MIISIQDIKINTNDIKKLYPVAIVSTGYEDETTHISLEWLDNEGVGKVEVIGYAIIFQLVSDEKKEFFYKNRDDFDEAIVELQNQLNSK
ncbi:MAG: phosphomannomutase [Sulfurovaceae bacterium]|jgi:hypothetical protein|nr:phosphomannomutase [Sulfurovaceae bacterium]MDD5548221.1 phosphomannomutase [Sulfurovaceae bacterium]